ncbi:TOX high mobility group box family member 4-B [Liparis tanakae]|uniref:TOX high mobility group box family member 4-B n=1 Tax=Liparis tanakae TaxID=230148 RepID=A0A4Z2G9Z2_9TELE|nr:TOX high mobility group box family member 4-B [Liparis tanakae]
MDLNFYSDLTDGTGPHDGDPQFLDPQAFNGFDTDSKFPGGSDNYLTISGSSHPFLSSSEEFEIPPISLDPDSALSVSDVVSHFGELSDSGPSGSVVVPGNAVVEGDDPSFASTFVNAPSQGLEHLSLGVIAQSGGSALLGSSLGMDLGHPIGSQFSSSSPVTIDVPLGDMSHGLLGSSQLTTIDQSELGAQLGLGLGGGAMLQRPQSPDNHLGGKAGKGGGGEKDPNEPRKPVSAYALFFRDTQAAIKGQNPNATFGEVSKIVASMWDSLGEEQKQVYKRKNEAAKKEYLRALTEYRVGKNSQAPIEVMDTSPSPPSPPPAAPVPVVMAAHASSLAARSTRSQQYNPEENTITNICTSNIILDLPQVTTRSRTGAIKPQAPPAAAAPPTVAKIIIKQMQLPSGAVTVTAISAPSSSSSSPRQPPPLQQMQSTSLPPRLQQMVHAQAPPPLQAKPRGGGAGATAPPPLQIKVVAASASRQADSIIVTSAGGAPASGLAMEAGQSADATADEEEEEEEEVGEVEEGMEVEVNVAPVPGAALAAGRITCMRAGCTRPAVESQDWDKEYCSNECVATHCRDVFMAWCAIRGQNSTSVA